LRSPAAELGDVAGLEHRKRDVSVGSHARNLDPSDPIRDRARELLQHLGIGAA
jgi:hypothetical protein